MKTGGLTIFVVAICLVAGVTELIKRISVERKNLLVKKVPVADYCKARGHVQGLWDGSDWKDTTYVVDYKDSSMLIEYRTVKKSYGCIRCKNAFPSFDTMLYSCKRIFPERSGQGSAYPTQHVRKMLKYGELKSQWK
jgi:hypothetical protein